MPTGFIPATALRRSRSVLRDLSKGGFRVTLSLELFNRKLWSQDPLIVVQTGLEKMRALVKGL